MRSIANLLIDCAERDGVEVDANKLHVLVYIAHGIAAAEGRPLVYEQVRAWPQGAVFPELFEALLPLGLKPIPQGWRIKTFCPVLAAYKPAPIPEDQQISQFIERIWAHFGRMDRHRLAAFAFASDNTPWRRITSTGRTTELTEPLVPEELIALQFNGPSAQNLSLDASTRVTFH